MCIYVLLIDVVIAGILIIFFSIFLLIINDGIIKFMNAGIKVYKNDFELIKLFCHIINVVISPNGLKTPPAFAAMTILIELKFRNFLSCFSIDVNIDDINNTVVKLSAIGEIKNANNPVIQYNFLYDILSFIIVLCILVIMSVVFITFIYVIVINKNINNSQYVYNISHIFLFIKKISSLLFLLNANINHIIVANNILNVDFLIFIFSSNAIKI